MLVAGPVDRISYQEAQKLTDFRPARLGDQFGPLWATYWFQLKTVVPAEWKGRRVDLLWGTHSEATLWIDGQSIQGLNNEPTHHDQSARCDATLTACATGGETLNFQIEMACNRNFGAGGNSAYGFKNVSPYLLDRAEIALFDEKAWELYFDFLILQGLEAEHSKGMDKTWGGMLLSELNRFANTYDPDDRATWDAASAILKALYQNHNGSATHELSAIGHAHIDTAWLWPLAETERKCERTFSTVTTYMDSYPEFKFACSQAQQYEWIKQRNPALYERIREKVRNGQFIPVGGTWVEPDCNIPSGESLSRQFLLGQRFFMNEFGIRHEEFWNPDVFGYNGQIPQICRLSGIRRFLTQKLSWNRFNKPRHHTFTWEGIDGSEVFTHFPSLDTYTAMVTVADLRETVRNYKDHDRSRHSLMLFGYGDGGGGPTKRMIETLRRAKDLEGLPRTTIRSCDEFFSLLEADCTDRIRHIGEIYFEFHRGCYTTQAHTKRGNRKCEFLLHNAEFLAALAMSNTRACNKSGCQYPAAELEELWKILLVNQFHDILPGSSIGLVYEDAERHYAEIENRARALINSSIGALGLVSNSATSPDDSVVINTIGFPRAEVAETPKGEIVFIETPSYGYGQIIEAPDMVSASTTRTGSVILENSHLRAEMSKGGSLVSLTAKECNRETMAAPGNQILIYADTPNACDAWDVDPFHMEQESACPPAFSCSIIEQSPLRAAISYERKIGLKSGMRQIVRLDAASRRLEFHTEVDWHEDHKMLKAAFPVNVRAMNATYEMQFGCIERPTHFNTTYDLARYEVPGHKWADISEHGFGVALLSESKYGYSTFCNTMRLSLLRSPKHPDPQADMGEHSFAYAIMPHAGTWQQAGIVAESFRFNVPVLFARADSSVTRPASFVSVDDPNLVLDTIKKAEDSNALVLRLYECHGARGTAHLKCGLPYKHACFCNILEEVLSEAVVRDGMIRIPYTPFKIISLILRNN